MIPETKFVVRHPICLAGRHPKSPNKESASPPPPSPIAPTTWTPATHGGRGNRRGGVGSCGVAPGGVTPPVLPRERAESEGLSLYFANMEVYLSVSINIYQPHYQPLSAHPKGDHLHNASWKSSSPIHKSPPCGVYVKLNSSHIHYICHIKSNSP